MPAVRISSTCAPRTFELYESLLEDSKKWSALHWRGRTLGAACLAFSLLATTACALEQLAFRHLRQPRYHVFMLLLKSTEEHALWLLGLPRCRLDSWTALFLQRYSTASALLSLDCRMFLMAFVSCLRLDIIGQETLNAQLRRLSLKGQTWIEKLEHVSAASFCQQSRTREQWRHMSFAGEAEESEQMLLAGQKRQRHTGRNSREQPSGNVIDKSAKRRRRGCGGIQRTNFSDFLRSHSAGKNEDERRDLYKQAHAYDRQVRARGDMQEVEARAKVATCLHAAGAVSFGPRWRAANPPPTLPPRPCPVDFEGSDELLRSRVEELLHATRGQLVVFDVASPEIVREAEEKHEQMRQVIRDWDRKARGSLE